MQHILDFVHWVMSLPRPANLLALAEYLGVGWLYAVLVAIVFAETGLLVGFFLPGDSLLFAAGLLCTSFEQNGQPVAAVFNYWLLAACLMVAAIVGDAVNYALGRQMGVHVFEKGRLRFVKHDHLLAAKAFYEKHGMISIVLARFVPLVRTFTPFVAGVAQMSYPAFAFYNIIGGVGWVLSMTAAGYWLGQVDVIRRNFELAVIAIIVVSVLPVVIGGVRHWRERKLAAAADAPPKA